MESISTKIISLLPYEKPFLFVDELTEISDTLIKGNYTFTDDHLFKGHFFHQPVIPGVLLIEVAAQIGLVCHYLHLNPSCGFLNTLPLLASVEVEFLNKAELSSKLFIEGKKIYLRHNTLKSKVTMYSRSDIEIMRMTAICKLRLNE